MLTTKITVYRNERPAKNVKVSLEFTGLTNLGFTRSYYTNSDGVAYVEHVSTGNAKLYLDGSSRGSVRAPGQEVVYL